MTISVQPLTNDAYGFPKGKPRRVAPVALACIHVTGNSRTAAYTDLHAAAQAERNYANRAGSTGPSSHFYVARDGWAIQAVDPLRYAAWSNGDVDSPNTANPGIRAVLALRAKGYNANEAYWLEFENVGFGTSYPITAAQKDFMAAEIAAHARRTGLPISRATVHGHWEINGVDRRNCPSSYAQREAFLGDVIARAAALEEEDMDDRIIPEARATVKAGPVFSDFACTRPLHSFVADVPGVQLYGRAATAAAIRVDLIGGTGEDIHVGYVPMARVTVAPADCGAAVAAEYSRVTKGTTATAVVKFPPAP